MRYERKTLGAANDAIELDVSESSVLAVHVDVEPGATLRAVVEVSVRPDPVARFVPVSVEAVTEHAALIEGVTGSGVYRADVAGFLRARVRLATWISGTADVAVVASHP